LTCTANSHALKWDVIAQQPIHKARKDPSKLERLAARITLEQKRIIELAAGLRGISVTEFVVVSAHQAATNAIKDYEIILLHDEAR